MINTAGATCGAGSAYPYGAPEITPRFWWGSCCLLFSFICCVRWTIDCLFVFFIFSYGVVNLFSIYKFDCPSGTFRTSFPTWSLDYQKNIRIRNFKIYWSTIYNDKNKITSKFTAISNQRVCLVIFEGMYILNNPLGNIISVWFHCKLNMSFIIYTCNATE